MPLLVERLFGDAVRKALHHQRPVIDRRQNERRHIDVVAEELALGDAELGQKTLARLRRPSIANRPGGPHHRPSVRAPVPRAAHAPLRTRQPASRLLASGAIAFSRGVLGASAASPSRRRRFRRCGAARTTAGVGGALLSSRVTSRASLSCLQTQVDGLPQKSVARPLREPDLRDEVRPHPVRSLHRLERIREGTSRDRARVEERRQPIERLLIEAGANRAGPTEGTRPVVIADEQRTEMLARLPRLGPTANDELLLSEKLELAPGWRAAPALVDRL